MRIILNILWIILGGLMSALGWIVIGCLWCITVVGIPVGLQCFKLSSISFNPFGKVVRYDDSGVGSFLLNVLWFIFGGLEMALSNFLWGVVLCITIIGIPFGKQFFKIAKLSLRPFGAIVERENFL
ncbi:MAG: YccF domain-containing protein [Lachnospiraceae bacterium]|nr:YccF domain-containing protein [Lachnospiraceae bacterium]